MRFSTHILTHDRKFGYGNSGESSAKQQSYPYQKRHKRGVNRLLDARANLCNQPASSAFSEHTLPFRRLLISNPLGSIIDHNDPTVAKTGAFQCLLHRTVIRMGVDPQIGAFL